MKTLQTKQNEARARTLARSKRTKAQQAAILTRRIPLDTTATREFARLAK